MMKLYALVGSAGIAEETPPWIVRVFRDPDEAEAYGREIMEAMGEVRRESAAAAVAGGCERARYDGPYRIADYPHVQNGVWTLSWWILAPNARSAGRYVDTTPDTTRLLALDPQTQFESNLAYRVVETVLHNSDLG